MEYKVSELYNSYPVQVTSKDFESYLGINLTSREVIQGDSEQKVSVFLDTIHRHVYDFLIYNTGDRELKDAIILKYKDRLEKSIKIALLTQGQYLLNGGNIELYNGVIKTVQGVAYNETPDTIAKIICPSIINILSSTKPNILFAGE